MTLTVYGVPLSPFVRKVRLCLAEKKVEVELVEERYWEADPDFMRRNPAGKVPVVKYDGRILAESQAICEYVEEVHPAPPLMPKAPALTGGVNSAISHARKAELDQAEAALKAAEAKPAAKVIDPAAPSTTVALNLADVEDMRHQLDAIATDVVNYQCDVSIQVPRTQDYPWLATLLTKRVKRIDSGYDLKIHRQILKQIPAQVVLIPRKAD